MVGARNKRMRSSRSRRRISREATARRGRGSAADHYQLVFHSTLHPSAEGLGGPICRSRPIKRLACDGSLITFVENENGTPLDVGASRERIDGAEASFLGARPRLLVPGLSKQSFRRRPSRGPLGGRRRHEPREPHVAVHATPPAAARGRLQLRARSVRGLYFRRPDGRAIPRFGYRARGPADDSGSPENPSIEVREPRAVYHARAA